MNKAKKRQLSFEDIITRIKFIGVLFVIVVVGVIYLLLMLKINNIEKHTLTEKSIVECNGKKVFEGDIKKFKLENVKSGDVYTIYMKVPNVEITNATIKYDNVNFAVDLYQDNKLVKRIGENISKGGIVCHAFNKIALNKIYKNQEIKMCIRVINGSSLAFLPNVYLMDTQDSDLDYFYNMLMYIILAVYLFVIGTVGLLIASYSGNKDVINRKLIILSLGSIVCTLYFISMYQVIPISSDNLIMDAYCEYITTIGVHVMLNMYFIISNPKGKRTFSVIMTSASALFLVIVISMQALRIKPFNDFMDGVTIISIATAINFALTFVKNKKNVIDKKVIMLASSVILALVGLYSVITIFFANLKENALIIIPIVISLALSMEFFELIFEISDSLVTSAQKQALKDMAYTDNFTGLFNRRGLDMNLKECLEKIYLVYLFDINGLKKINDKYGHSAGDYVIRSFANELKTVFANGLCARIGGDEFVVVCKEEKNKEIQLDALKESINNINKDSGKEYILEYSYGISPYIPTKDAIEDVIKKADKEMYKMKK